MLHNKISIFTFRTFPHIDKLHQDFDTVFVFGKLRSDLEKFKQIIAKEKPDIIVGFARSTQEFSSFETRAVNMFHGKTLCGENKEYSLFVPDIAGTGIEMSQKQTTSFCNWTAYRLAEFLHRNSLKKQLIL